MFLPTYKPVLINDEEWKKIWESAYEKLKGDPMYLLLYSETKVPRALKFMFLRNIPVNPELPKLDDRTEILNNLERENIRFDAERHFIIKLFIESFKKHGVAVFELWDKSSY